MSDMIKTGEIDARHFLIAIVAIVAIVALTFVTVYVSGGLKGKASDAATGASYRILEDGVIILDWTCFEQCLELQVSPSICKEDCSIS